MSTTKPALHLSGDKNADALISRDPLALLIGMVLDQQFPLERAFAAPALLVERLGTKLDVRAIASMDEETLAAAFRQPPALHRFPGSMAGRVQSLCRIITEKYGGKPAAVWKTAKSGEELLGRLEALPGFGAQKAKIFVALLGTQLEVQPKGWREVSAPYGEEDSHRSIADIDSPETLIRVREYKRAMKAADKGKAKGSKPAGSKA
ncbi:MAG: HhH-GPD-type base excision DNA repair protein [Acidimicrobiales bacterium]